MLLTGAQIVIECLKEQGVDTVFGYPGGTILFIYDELFKNKDKIHHYLTAHEQGAAHAADGYARSTGKVGVCMATSGPGATNLVTGIATAYMDSTPMVAITANVAVPWLGRDTFQEVDITGVTAPITKHNFLVMHIEELADTLRKAFKIAQEGRPGPVLVDIPKDITIQQCEYTPQKPLKLREAPQPFDEEIDVAVAQIEKSKHPLIYMGGGVVKSSAAKQVKEFAEKIDAPVTSSLMGMACYDNQDERFTGLIGMHGTKASNMASTHCDLLIVLGARFSDRVVSRLETFAPQAQVLHVDIDAAEVNKNVFAHYSLVGDLCQVLTRLNEKLSAQKHEKWMAQIHAWKKEKPTAPKNKLNGKLIVETLSKILPKDAVVCTEVGQHQMWTAQYYDFTHENSFVTSGGLGTMGFGLGASIGSQIGNPQRRVVNIAGDGCFRMNLIEIATAVEFKLPIIMVLLDNHSLGMVRQWQTLFYDSRYSQTDLRSRQTDFCKIAEGFGAAAYKLEDADKVEEVFAKALLEKGPTLVHCIIDRDDKVLPMVKSGEAIDQLIMEDPQFE